MTEFPSWEEWLKSNPEGTKAEYIRQRKQFYLQKSKEDFKKSVKSSKTKQKTEKKPFWLGMGADIWKDPEETEPEDERGEVSKELEEEIRRESKQ